MELWDAYDENGTPLGFTLIRGEPIPPGIFHLVCEVLVQHTDGTYLVMQRDFCKKKYPGMFEATASGSAVQHEKPETGAIRELWEETGIQVNTPLIPLYHCVGKDAIYYGYLYTTDCDKDAVVLQQGETIHFEWFPKEPFLAFLETELFVPSRRERLTSYIATLKE